MHLSIWFVAALTVLQIGYCVGLTCMTCTTPEPCPGAAAPATTAAPAPKAKRYARGRFLRDDPAPAAPVACTVATLKPLFDALTGTSKTALIDTLKLTDAAYTDALFTSCAAIKWKDNTVYRGCVPAKTTDGKEICDALADKSVCEVCTTDNCNKAFTGDSDKPNPDNPNDNPTEPQDETTTESDATKIYSLSSVSWIVSALFLRFVF